MGEHREGGGGIREDHKPQRRTSPPIVSASRARGRSRHTGGEEEEWDVQVWTAPGWRPSEWAPREGGEWSACLPVDRGSGGFLR